jgi:hypothetical protein
VWGYSATHGDKVIQKNYETYGQIAKKGDIVATIIDRTQGTILFEINGKSLGQAFREKVLIEEARLYFTVLLWN